MKRKEKFILLKNAAANVIRGGAASVVAIALPPFLARLMSADSYGAWSLVLQLSAYVGYLDFGIQTAVGRFVAHANEKGDAAHRDRLVSTAFAALATAIVSLLADRPRARQMGERGRVRQHELYSSQTMATRVYELYDELLARAPRQTRRLSRRR